MQFTEWVSMADAELNVERENVLDLKFLFLWSVFVSLIELFQFYNQRH